MPRAGRRASTRTARPALLPYLREISLKGDIDLPRNDYPFAIPAIRKLETISFHPAVTFFVGENGSGKSTLLEAIVAALGWNAEGGSRNFNFSTHRSHSTLGNCLRIVRSLSWPRDNYFLRAESFFNVASEIDRLDETPGGGPPIIGSYGGISFHQQSHGEGFLSLMTHRFRGNGLYLLDEPEGALSASRQLDMLRRMHELTQLQSQFIIATHSPILLAFPNALILTLDEHGYRQTEYSQTQPYRAMKAFLDDPGESVSRALLSADPTLF